MTRARLIFLSVAGAAAAWLLWSTASKSYFAPRRDLLNRIDEERTTIARLQETINKEVAQRRELRDAAARTLAGTSEEAVSILRERLNTIGHGIGLTDLRVSTGNPKSVASPARSEYRDRRWKSLTAQPDFYTLGAEFSGQGTFEQAVRAVEVIAAEPYLSRIDRFSLRPRRGGEVVDLSVSLTTVILPGADPPPQPAPGLAQAPSYASISGKNLFRAPPPAPEVKPEVKPAVAVQPPAPAPVPWGDWVVTGIVWIDQQPELWLRNRKTSEAKQLRAGDRILEAQVEEISRAQAVVSIEGSLFSIQIGQSLEERRPVNQ
ncbi:MAG: hypothetical protein IT430_07340 [Phycisphaerales bacterium]|nr:hypothetical protein [Phycisphaerales bacterium]